MDINVTYNLTELRELAKEFPDFVTEETKKVLELIAEKLESAIAEKTPKGVGGAAGLSGSIAGEVKQFGSRTTATIGTPLEYGEVIEMGRRPGRTRPPVAALIPWVRSILGISDAKEQRSVAYVIARKIGMAGFEGVHMFEKAWNENEQWVQAQLYSIGDKVVRRVDSKS